MSVKIFARKLWNAVQPKWVTRHPGLPVKKVYIHHGAGHNNGLLADTDGDGIPDEEEAIWLRWQRFHMESRGWSDIAYNFGVGLSGCILEGRGWDRQGGATGHPEDRVSLSICAIGNFQKQPPSDNMITAIVNWIITGIEHGYIHPEVKILGHRDAGINATACPGQYLYKYLPEIRSRVRDGRLEEETMQGPVSGWHDHLMRAPDGTKDEAVRVMQLALWQWGHMEVSQIDGVLGPQTRAAHRAWVAEEFPTYTFLTDRPTVTTWAALIAGPEPEQFLPDGLAAAVRAAAVAIEKAERLVEES